MVEYVNGVEKAPQAIGPYSQATVSGNLAFLSGQIPLDPSTGALVDGGIEAQTEQVMKNLYEVLTHLDANFSQVVKTTIFLSDLGNFKAVNEIYAKWLGDSRPARATVEVAALPLGSLVEMDMVVVRG